MLNTKELGIIEAMIKRHVLSAIETFDETGYQNFATIGKVTDKNTKNILKLQAQVTALKEMLIAKGVVSRDRLYELECRELDRLERKPEPEPEKAVAKA